jgi:N-dimethylarginine dimethylaminohydrolase
MINGTYVPAETKNAYGEFNMYGQLKEVVLGNERSLKLPELTPEFMETHGGVLQPEMHEVFKKCGNKPVIEVMPEYIEAHLEETKLLKEALEKHGVKVHIARENTDEEIRQMNRGTNAVSQIFGAEPIWIVGRNVLENAWSADFAWSFLFPVRELHQPYIDADPNVLHFTAPAGAPVRDYSYEGGDVLNLGDGRVLVAQSRSSTNERGANWAKRMLEHDGYKVEIIELPDTGIHHLFAVMCIAGPKLLIAYEDSFPDGLPEFINDFDVIWINREEALATAACCTMINPTTILCPAETPRVSEELRKRGITPVEVPFKTHAYGAGGIRCKISVVRREI